MMNYSPFKYNSVEDYIPLFYKTLKGDKHDYSWFNTPPRFTVYRVNSLITNAEQVIPLIMECFKKDAGIKNCSAPAVFQHKLLQDCVVVDSWCEGGGPGGRGPAAVVDLPCACAALRGAQVFAPGVLALPFDVKEGSLVNIYADLEGKCTRGLSGNFNHNKFFIGEGVLHMNRHKLFNNNVEARGIAIEVSRTLSGVPNFSLSSELGMLQNFPSIVCTYVLDVQKDSIVLDMCAAPGNKTTHIANLMENKGVIIALDKTQGKVKQIEAQCKNFGITNIKAFVYDSTKAAWEKSQFNDRPPFKFGVFDRILLDVPCSALGKRPQLRNNISINQLKSYPCLQKKLFSNAVRLLKSGGILVYSTCTITLEENEGIVSWALKHFPELDLCKAKPYFGMSGLPENGLTKEQCECVQRFGPSSNISPENDTVGFFIAKFKKK